MQVPMGGQLTLLRYDCPEAPDGTTSTPGSTADPEIGTTRASVVPVVSLYSPTAMHGPEAAQLTALRVAVSLVPVFAPLGSFTATACAITPATSVTTTGCS